MGKKKGKGPKQSSPVTGSSKDQYGPDKQPDGLKSDRPPSPVPSGVSMISDNSTGDRPNMAGEPVPSGPRLMSGRPPSPVPSGVSMISDNSTGDRPNMREDHVPSDPRLKSDRPPSPVPSGVSMISDNSTGDRPNMREDHVPPGPRLKSGGPPSPVPNCVSMKSDNSTGDRPNMREEPVPSGPSSRENIEGEGEQCEDTSVTHPGKSDDPDIKDKLDDPHTSSDRDDDADSAVCSEVSMPRDNDFSNTQPHNLIHQSEVCKRCEGSCGVCLGNVHHAVKHCKTCSVSYCETHVADHYKSPAFSSHELADHKQTSRETPAKEQSLQRSSSGDIQHPSEVRIVLLGCRTAGKSSSGNTILGREEFDLKRKTAQCVMRQGEVSGRQVTIVEAPGWWSNVNLKDTPELTKQEIVLSVSLCPPGPHAVLLVIEVDSSISKDKGYIWQEHIELLSESVWSHTMVLFTRGDWLGDTTIEQYIESEGALQSLVEKCGNRYHVLNNENTGDDAQVTQLLEKIEVIVEGNRGHHFEMDINRLEEIQEKRMKAKERAKERLMMVEKQRQHLQSTKLQVHSGNSAAPPWFVQVR